MNYIVLAWALLLQPAQQPKLLAPYTNLAECQAQAAKMTVERKEMIEATVEVGGKFVCLVAVPATI